MNTLQICSIIISGLCLIITTVLAWVMVYRVNKTQVTFAGNPVDKKEFDAAIRDKTRQIEHLEYQNEKVWIKMESDARKIEATISAVDKTVAATDATIKALGAQVGLLTLEIQNLNRK